MTLPARSEVFAVCAGIAALDVIMEVETLPGVDQRVMASSAVLSGGGPAATAAVAIARLGGRAEVAAVTGDDDAGGLIRAGLLSEGVGTELVAVVLGHRSAISIGLIPATDPLSRALVAYQNAAAVPHSDLLADRCAKAAWVHVDHAGWAIVAWLQGRGITTPVSLDGGNPVSGLSLDGVALYAPSATELLRWTGAASVDEGLDIALDGGARICVATLGARGAVARSSLDPFAVNVTAALGRSVSPDATQPRWTVRAGSLDAPIRSTLGAGDVYHGALLAALMRGDHLAGAMAFAAVAAARSCEAIDGRSAIPSATETDAEVSMVAIQVTPPGEKAGSSTSPALAAAGR
jgi:sulfofructose kinase